MAGKSASRGSWFRLYERILNDPKIWALSDEEFRNWILILAVAKKHDHDGRLPPANVIAFGLRVTMPSLMTSLVTLSERGLVDKVSGGTDGWVYAVHDWGHWQCKSDTSRERQRRHLERHRPVTDDVMMTPRARVRAKKDFLLIENPNKEKQENGVDDTVPATVLASNGSGHPIENRDPATGLTPERLAIAKAKTPQFWEVALQQGNRHGRWAGSVMGPRPGEPGCLVPASLVTPSVIADAAFWEWF